MTLANPPTLSIGSIPIQQINGLYSLNDLHQASGGEEKYKPAFFLRNDQTKALVAEMAKGANLHLYLKTVRGKHGGTYACRQLVIAYAAWISAAFQLKVINVFLDTVAPATQQPLASPPPYTVEQAYALANQTATIVADKMYRVVLSGKIDTNADRWLLLVSNHGTQVSMVDPNSFVLTPTEIADGIKSGEVLTGFSEVELMQVAQAVMERIQVRLTKPVSDTPALTTQSGARA